MPGLDRDTVWSFFAELAAAAARETLPRFRAPLAVENKAGANRFDPVTEADRAAESAMRALISERFPDHGIRGEESADKAGSSHYTWIIDPIDGTRSYVSGMPTWGTLVGLLDRDSPHFGMMSQPYVGESFFGASPAAGAAHAEHRGRDASSVLRTRAAADLSAATLFATTPDMFRPGVEADAFGALSRAVRLTRFGADCYGYCLLAAGHVDLVVEANLAFYDIAPVIPIVEGAGGVVTDWTGRPVTGGGRAVAAASAALLEAALAVLAEPG